MKKHRKKEVTTGRKSCSVGSIKKEVKAKEDGESRVIGEVRVGEEIKRGGVRDNNV
jgi:hypothetical protein